MAKITDLTPGTWNVDQSHSAVSFSARHLMISKVRGRFESFGGTITVTDDPLRSTVSAVVDTKSVTTGDESRERPPAQRRLLRRRQPSELRFVSTSIEHDGDDFRLAGLLTSKMSPSGGVRPRFDGVSTESVGDIFDRQEAGEAKVVAVVFDAGADET